MAKASAQDLYKPSSRARNWLMIAIVTAFIGAVISIYTISHHLTAKAQGATDAACNINSTLSCDAVALSQYSEIAGIPLGVYGLGYFLAMAVLAALGLKGGRSAKDHLEAYAAMVGIGLLASIALAVVSATQLGAACPTCIGIYIVTIAQAGLLWVFRAELPKPFSVKQAFSGGLTAAIVVALTVAGYSYMPLSNKTPSSSFNTTPEGGAISDGTQSAPSLSTQAEDIPIARSPYSGLGEDYRKGPDTAAVTIVEFVDFQCPACRAVGGVLDQLHRDYPDKVQVVFRNYPLNSSCNSSMQSQMHEHSCNAAVMARCSGQFGKFWAYHDLVFANQANINTANLKAWGKEIGLTEEQVNACWNSEDILAKIKDDVAIGNRLGVDATPSLFINGRKVLGGRDLQSLKNEIDKLIY